MSQPRRTEDLDRNLALELVRVTEAAAMAAGRWVGRGDKEGGDGAAVDAMRHLINSLPMRGVVVIGEGEKDDAPMLFNGEHVGDWKGGPEVDVAVDPIDGTTLMSKGMPNAIAVLAVAERGAMFDPSAVFYMEKLAVGPDCADVIELDAGIGENLRRIAKVKRSSVSDVTVCILDRPRHAELVREIRNAGARIRFITRRRHRGRHQRRTRAVRCGRPRRNRRHAGGHRRRVRAQVHRRRDPGEALAQGRCRAGEGHRRRARPRPGPVHRRPGPRRQRLLRRHRRHLGRPARGVRYRAGYAYTQSIVMRSKSGTIRIIDSFHRLEKLRRYSVVDFDGAPSAALTRGRQMTSIVSQGVVQRRRLEAEGQLSGRRCRARTAAQTGIASRRTPGPRARRGRPGGAPS